MVETYPVDVYYRTMTEQRTPDEANKPGREHSSADVTGLRHAIGEIACEPHTEVEEVRDGSHRDDEPLVEVLFHPPAIQRQANKQRK